MTFVPFCLLLLAFVLCDPDDDRRISIDRAKRRAHPHVKTQDADDEDEGGGDAKARASAVIGSSKRENKRPKKWDHWTKWSSCSVSCGVGKITRWRHCVSEGCASGEKEAQIKTCTLPAC